MHRTNTVRYRRYLERCTIRGVLVLCVGILFGVLPGCAGIRHVIGFKEQVARVERIGRIDGRIDTEGPADGTLVVVLGRPGENGEIVGVDSFVRIEPGTFAFALSAGRYQIGAYEDRNRNGLLDPDERAVRVRDSPVIELEAGGRVTRDITIDKGALMSELTEPVDVLGLVERSPKQQGEFSLWAWSVMGETAPDLGEKRFGPESGRRGLWKIMDFLNEGLAGVYFVEPYDPDRIPVLFVHGISGYPREFETLIESIDRDRFQAWFYFYPSGFHLDGVSSHLAVLLERLQTQYAFGRLAVVAHSMGGLVSRGAILKYARETGRDDVRLFVSISTPWHGDVKAEKAGESPIALPESLADMNPSSDYLRRLFFTDDDGNVPRPLPASVSYHLMFGFGMTGASAVANDGTVGLSSQLRPIVQEQAVTQRGFDETHTGILRASALVERVNDLLADRFR